MKYWVELGASIMMDKPIIGLVIGDRKVPERLERVSDEIIRLPNGIDPEGSEELRRAIERLQEKYVL